MLLLNWGNKKKTKKILKAIPCQRATNLFEVGLKKVSIFIKRENLEKLFTGHGAKYFDFEKLSSYDTLWDFHSLYQTVCRVRNFWNDLFTTKIVFSDLCVLQLALGFDIFETQAANMRRFSYTHTRALAHTHTHTRVRAGWRRGICRLWAIWQKIGSSLTVSFFNGGGVGVGEGGSSVLYLVSR